MDVIEYCTEEVQRQGHDTTVLDGIERVGWMLDAWAYALSRASTFECFVMGDIIRIGQRVEPGKNRWGIRSARVRVGQRACPDPGEVEDLLLRLLRHGDALSPIEWYKEFELIHPFVDGNGPHR